MNFKSFILIPFLCIGLFSQAQEDYQTRKINAKLSGISNYSYQMFFSTDQGVYYHTKLVIDAKDQTQTQVSPLGTEALFVAEGDAYVYDTYEFEVLFKDKIKLKLKEDPIVKIVNNGDGSAYFLLTEKGALYQANILKKDVEIIKLISDSPISLLEWNANLNNFIAAFDNRLFFYDPVLQKTTEGTQLDQRILSMRVNEKDFEIILGLEDGTLMVLNQSLDKTILNTKLSGTGITGVLEDPVDHYLYAGDQQGRLYTYDRLKESVYLNREVHQGNLSINGIHQPSRGKKYIITTGLDNTYRVFNTSKLEPNYLRIVNLKMTEIRENFIKIKQNESDAAYDKRVTAKNVNTYLREQRIQIVDSLAKTKSSLESDIIIGEKSLSLNIKPFPEVEIPIYSQLNAKEDIDIEEIHFQLEKDNTFSITDVVLNAPEGPIKFSSDKKTMAAYEEEISLAISKKVASKEAEIKNTLSKIVEQLKSDGQLNGVELSANATLKKEKDKNGVDELNLYATFMSKGTTITKGMKSADYPPGKYQLEDAQATVTLMNFFLETTKENLSEYLSPGRKITFNITGGTDKSGIAKAIPYKNEFGPFKNFPYYFQGELSGLSLDESTGITLNSQLGFMRTYGVRNYLENNTELFNQTENSFVHFSEQADQLGPQFRTIKLELVIHGVDKL